MPKQPTFPSLCDAVKKNVTLREQFLADIGAVVPWRRPVAGIAPHNVKGRAPSGAAGDKGARVFLPNGYAL